jgi:UDP:flavonoid glycosyltransferase YjiC (YdhE family)
MSRELNEHEHALIALLNISADKRIKGFITHGGLLSIEEATYYGVPLIVFPIFAEQDFNANNVERTGGGIQLEISRVSKVELQNAIHNLLTDPR